MNDSKMPSFKKWKIGDVTITRIVEVDSSQPVPPEWLLQTNAEVVKKHAWLCPDHATPEGLIRGAIQAFIIEASGKRILVDPCIGNDKPRESPLYAMRAGPFLEHLALAGFPPNSINVVLCTHLHTDHVGWNTRLVNGNWVPTFPNAQYLFSRVEFQHAQTDRGQDCEATFNDSVKPIVDAGLAQLVEFDHPITEEVSLKPSPGHTPGHCCIRIVSKGREAIITGDMMHHPIQACEPDVCSNFCVDVIAARETRKAFLRDHSESNVLILGTHFADPTGMHVRNNGQVWRMERA